MVDETIPFGDRERYEAAARLVGVEDNEPIVRLHHRYARTADAAWILLARDNGEAAEPRVVDHNGVLSRMVDGALEPYDSVALCQRMSTVTAFMGAKGPVKPPGDLAEYLLRRERAEYWGVPRVTRVTQVPILGPDGRPIYEPGLHPSGIWYRPTPELARVQAHVGDVDSVDDVSAARDLLLTDLLGDFDFEDESSLANATALLLLPFVREFIGDHPTPLHLALAPQPGAGKTFLIDTCLLPGCGSFSHSGQPHSDEEFRKFVTAALLAGRPMIFLDNISARLEGGTLAAALTSTSWTDRILGYSKVTTQPIRVVWCATGNNVDASSEIFDRIVPIWIEPRDGVPARRRPAREFRHPDLHDWARRHRARLAGAAMTLVLHWAEGVAHARPDGTFDRDDGWRSASVASMGSFERWAQVLGGNLAAADVPGFLGNRDKIAAIDPEEEECTAFFVQVRAWSDGREFVARDLAAACGISGPLRDFLPSGLDGRADLTRGLADWMRARDNSTHGSLTLRSRSDTAGGLKHYWIEARG